MPIAVDLEQKTLTGSIGELADSLREGPRGVGILGRARAELGNQVHERYRTEQAAGSEAVRFEQPLSLDFEVDDFAVHLGGRMDGLVDDGRQVRIEEVKSVLLPGAELARSRPDFFPDFCLQLRAYGLAFARQHPDRTVVLRLVLYSLLDNSRHAWPVDPHPKQTAVRIADLVREHIQAARDERARARLRQRVAAALKFPYPAMRPHQGELIAAIEHGLRHDRPLLTMAPTGIGKTVSGLLSAMRVALEKNALTVFVTAKTTQQKLVADTFEHVCRASGPEAARLRCLTLRAKQGMCPPGTLLCHPEVCPYLKEFQARLLLSHARDQLLAAGMRIDPEVIFGVGEAHRLCPFALSLALVDQVDLLVCDYNYVYDPAIALAGLFSDDDRTRALVVVDEAHNLFDRARGYHSPFLARGDLDSLRKRIGRNEFLAESDRSDQMLLKGLVSAIRGPELFGSLHRLCDDLSQQLTSLHEQAERENPGQQDDCRPLQADLQPWETLADRAQNLLVAYVLYNRTHRLVHRDDPVLHLLSSVVRIRDALAHAEPEFVPYSAGPEAPNGQGFGVLCVNPARRLAERHQTVAGTLAMSATLTPLSYYSDVLGFSGLEPDLISMPSPFPAEHLGVFIAHQVSTTYRERDRHLQAIADLIVQTVSSRPGRYAAYFPSYRFLSTVLERLNLPRDQVLVQLPGMAAGVRNRLLEKLKTRQQPGLLMAVMGGALAEGVDLPGEELIGALVIGPGLPQVGFERSLMQAYFQERYEQGFAYAMLYPGMQRVIQAAGRVIRSPNDVGVIVLVGRRFAEPELARCLPEHWYRFGPAERVTDDLAADLKKFWDSLG